MSWFERANLFRVGNVAALHDETPIFTSIKTNTVLTLPMTQMHFSITMINASKASLWKHSSRECDESVVESIFFTARYINFGQLYTGYNFLELCVCSRPILQTHCAQTFCQVPRSLLKWMLTTWIILSLAPVISWLRPAASALQSMFPPPQSFHIENLHLSFTWYLKRFCISLPNTMSLLEYGDEFCSTNTWVSGLSNHLAVFKTNQAY